MQKIVIVLSLLLTLGCIKNKKNNAQSKHASAATNLIPEGPYWAAVRKKFSVDPLFANALSSGSKIIPENNPISIRLNEWVQKIHKNLRSSGSVGAHVPQPFVAVLADPTFGAYVSGTYGCYEFEIAPEDNAIIKEELTVLGKLNENEIERTYRESLRNSVTDCRKPSPAERSVIISMIEKIPEYLGCKIRTTPTGVRMSSDCYRHVVTDYDVKLTMSRSRSKIFMPWRASHLVFPVTANVVFVNSGLITLSGNEEVVVSALSHELAHYYRAHSAQGLVEPLFLYRQSEKPLPSRPEPLAASEGSPLALLRNRMSTAFELYAHAPWQQVGTVVWGSMIRGLEDVKRKCQYAQTQPKSCPLPCPELIAYSADPAGAIVINMMTFPPGKRPENYSKTFIENYKKFEEKFSQCLSVIAPNDPQVASVYYNSSEYNEFRYSAVDFHATNPKTIWEYFLSKEKNYEAAKQSALKDIEDAQNEKLSLYTSEQEADELGTEILVHAGLDPAWAVRSYLAVGRRGTYAGSTSFQNCHRLAEKGWKKADGTWEVLIPFGLIVPHHDFCFRAYNVARELEAHPEYAKMKFTPLDPAKWSELRSIARTLTPEEQLE